MDAARRQIRILHLEDSPRDAELIRRQLEISGFDCVIARAAGRGEYESALASGTFDIVLCDFNVPGYDTLPLSEAIRRMEGSELVAETLGEHVFDFFLRNKRSEWLDYRREVTTFELDRYLPAL